MLDNMEQIIEIMASQDAVKKAVVNSHDNNPWWPNDVDDWRMRMIIAGLSTRVSFRMLKTYVNTINNFLHYSYDEICCKTDDELKILLKPLGLPEARIKFVRSMINYIENNLKNKDFKTIPNSVLIADIAKNVNGASYKVGQCCVLYAKGYYCGIIPVDSGIKDMLAPCIGCKTGSTPIYYEKIRLELEDLAKSCNLLQIAEKTGYARLITLPNNDIPLTWWLHLVAINYKRHFCNNHKPDECPLVKSGMINKCCCGR